MEPTWLATKATRSSQLLTHGISGERTLCGLRVRAHRWYSLTDTELEMCRLCDPEAAPPQPTKAKRVYVTPMHGDIPVNWVPLIDLCTGLAVTYRQVDYWIRTGLIHLAEPPRGSGSIRYVTSTEATTVTVMAVLVKAGIDPITAARAARNGGWLAPGVRIILGEAAA